MPQLFLPQLSVRVLMMLSILDTARRLVSELVLPHTLLFSRTSTDIDANAQLPAPVVLPTPNATPAEFADALAVIVRRLQFCELHPGYSSDEDKTMDDFHALLRVSYPSQSVIWDFLMRHHLSLVVEMQRLNYRYACLYEIMGSNDLIRSIAGGKSPDEALESFRYIVNYRRLNQLEHGLLSSIDYDGDYSRTRRICFIGSGPLPISSWMLVERLRSLSPNQSWTITNIDINGEAHAQGHALFAALLGPNSILSTDDFPVPPNALPLLADGSRGRVEFLTTSAIDLDPTFIAQQDLVYCAAMVGSDSSVPSKADIITHLVKHLRPGARLLSRSGEGVKQVIYSTVREEWATSNGAHFECTVRLGYHLTSPVVIRKNC